MKLVQLTESLFEDQDTKRPVVMLAAYPTVREYIFLMQNGGTVKLPYDDVEIKWNGN